MVRTDHLHFEILYTCKLVGFKFTNTNKNFNMQITNNGGILWLSGAAGSTTSPFYCTWQETFSSCFLYNYQTVGEDQHALSAGFAIEGKHIFPNNLNNNGYLEDVDRIQYWQAAITY